MLPSIPAKESPGQSHAPKWRSRSSVLLTLCVVLLFSVELQTVALEAADLDARAGCRGSVGTLEQPQLVNRLEITKPGVYENYLVDSQWQGGNRVKITADDVTLRNCEIRHASGNGIGVFGTNVIIENCRIHHILAGTQQQQQDAHGITGRWGNVTIRNCEIFYTSGDSVQFDPDRSSAGQVLIEKCTFWAGPLPADAAGFRRGESPGENAVDTKTKLDGQRCQLTIRDCYFHGWSQHGPISNRAALNLKEHISASIVGCVFQNNEIALRVRGPGSRGGALVEIRDCAIYSGQVGVRIEDQIRDLKIIRLAFSDDVQRKYHLANGEPGPGYVNEGERPAPPIADLLHGS